MTMLPEQVKLWAKIEAFLLDDPESAFPFSARLARENGWSSAYTQRAIVEYKRFVFLGMTASHAVTPSVAVDQVWHLHLTYTRSYWEEFCAETLGQPFHHGPTKGGEKEGQKFVDWYQHTRSSYEAMFGHEPPADIWPSARVRFAFDSRIKQVSAKTHWIIPKPTWKRVSWLLIIVGALLTTGFLGVTAQTEGSTDCLVFVCPVGFVVIFLVVKGMIRGHNKKNGKGKGGGTSGCGGCGG